MLVPVEKTFREVKLDKAKWSRSHDAATGVTTYTSTDAAASVTFVKEDNADQEHTNVPAGKSFTTRGNKADLWELH